MRKLSRQPNASKNKLNSLSNGFKDPREKLMIDERNKTLWLCLFKKSLLEKVLSGVKHVRLDMTARDKGAPDKGHTTLFSSSKVVHYFPNFRSYLGMEYEQPWNMGTRILLFWKRHWQLLRRRHTGAGLGQKPSCNFYLGFWCSRPQCPVGGIPWGCPSHPQRWWCSHIVCTGMLSHQHQFFL